MSRSQQPRVLVVQHQSDCGPARFGPWLQAAGVDIDVRRPDLGEDLPGGPAAEHDGLLVLGGSMDALADTEAPWLPATRALLRAAGEQRVPGLGLCLGHQLATVAYGGRVARNPRGQQVGLQPVGWTPEAAHDALFGPVSAERPTTRVVHWNNDVVELPATAVRLAGAPGGEVQIARFADTVWGVQPHPEVDRAGVEPWAVRHRPDHDARGVDQGAILDEIRGAEAELGAVWSRLATGFARLVHARRTERMAS